MNINLSIEEYKDILSKLSTIEHFLNNGVIICSNSVKESLIQNNIQQVEKQNGYIIANTNKALKVIDELNQNLNISKY